MNQTKKYINREDFIRDRVSMHLGSLMNLYSNTKNPPSPDELFLKAVEITEKIWDLGKRFDEFPELDEKLKEKAFEEYCLNERQVGRYYASELWYYLTGKITPENFLNPVFPTTEELKRLYWGTIIHAGIQAIFGYKEEKYEISLGEGITIVCKPDLVLEDGTIVEIKTKEDIEIYDTLPQFYEYQCQAYLEALKKEEMRVYLLGWGFSRKLFKVQKSKELWEKIVNGIKEYHQKVVEFIRQFF